MGLVCSKCLRVRVCRAWWLRGGAVPSYGLGRGATGALSLCAAWGSLSRLIRLDVRLCGNALAPSR
eukprot:scaffold73908_cov35-Tisochrysis_lutea.AAC.1